MRDGKFDIVFIEDLERYHRVYEDAIASALNNAQIHFATSGKEGLEKIYALSDPDLVVLDLGLPDISGREVLEQLRSNSRFDRMPILLLTAQGGIDLQLQLLEEGADDFVEKSADPEVFLARIKAQMRHRVALEKLSQVALERDIFAAGVLHEILRLKDTIKSNCQIAKKLLGEDIASNKSALAELLKDLRQQANDIGSFAADVIKSTEVGHHAEATTVHLKDILLSIYGNNEIQIDGQLPTVQANASYLKMALAAIRRVFLHLGSDPSKAILITEQQASQGQHFHVTFRESIPDGRKLLQLGKWIDGESTLEDQYSEAQLQWALLESAMAKIHGKVSCQYQDGTGIITIEFLGQISIKT